MGKAQDATKARALRVALNSWGNSKLTTEQQRIMATIDVLGLAFFHLAKDLGNASIELRNKLNRLAEDAAQAATAAATVGLAFTPAGDYIDFYEAVNGKQFLTGTALTVTQRLLSTAGLIAGSGAFWRSIGDAAFVTKVTDAERFLDSAKNLGLNAVQTKAYAKFYAGLRDLPTNLQPKRLHAGTNERIAIIGRSMGNPAQGKAGVRDVSSKLNEAGYSGKVDIFDGDAISQAAKDDFRIKTENFTKELSETELKATTMYQENKSWIEKMKSQGNTIIDLGNPNNEASISYFYEMEKKIIFGD